VKKYWIVIVCIFVINGLAFCKNGEEYFSDTAKTYNKYLSLVNACKNYQDKLSDSFVFFDKIENASYVLNGKDIKFINLELTKGLQALEQSIAFYETGEKLIKSDDDAKQDENKLCFLRLLYTHLRITSYETFFLYQEIAGQNINVNRLICEENKLYHREKNLLNKIKEKIISEKFRESTLKSWKIIANNSANTKNVDILQKIVSSKYYQSFLSDNEKIKQSKNYFKSLVKEKRKFSARMIISDLKVNALKKASRVFGNFVGIFSLRKGKLFNNEDFINNSLKQLQPLDVILEKTPFRLTDVFIPGYWDHAGIYIGNEAQLKKIGVWDNPFVAKYHEEIKTGCVVIEALRSDVEFNTFKHFTDIDDYAHLRLKNGITIEKKKGMIISAFAQIGKKYDFSFDVESDKEIVCSELHYIVFDQVAFNTSEILEMNTISVDQIAENAFSGGEFLLINLFLDGIKVKKERMHELYYLLPDARSRQIKMIKKNLHHNK